MKKQKSGIKQGSECVQCKVCKNTFTSYLSDKRVYCSKKCYEVDHKAKIKICLNCNKEFSLPGQPKQKYCSRGCQHNHKTPWNKGCVNVQPKLLGEHHPGIKKRMAHMGLDWDSYNNWRDSKERYYAEVWRITNQQPLQTLPNYHKPRGRAGVQGAYQLDHIIPISEGFSQGIDPETIGCLDNLQFISWEDNLKKR